MHLHNTVLNCETISSLLKIAEWDITEDLRLSLHVSKCLFARKNEKKKAKKVVSVTVAGKVLRRVCTIQDKRTRYLLHRCYGQVNEAHNVAL